MGQCDLALVMSGEVVKAAPDLTVGLRALRILAPLFVLALVVYIVRMWTRSRIKHRLNASDYTISVAMVSISPLLTVPRAMILIVNPTRWPKPS